MSIEINGLMVTEDAMEYLLERTFWKQTGLQTKAMTDEAAAKATRFLTELGRDGYVPDLPGVSRPSRGEAIT